MKRYRLRFENRAKVDIRKYKSSGEKPARKKLINLLKEIAVRPRTGTGKPERLRGHNEREIWSRRITDKHRLIYEIQARLPHAHLLFASAFKRNLSYYDRLMDIMMMSNFLL